MGSGKKRIVIIDDEKTVAEMVSAFCKSFGFETRLLRGSRKLIQKIENYGPDLILLDLMMPEILGSELLKILKSTESTKNIPVIIISSFADSELAQESLPLTVGKLSKPVHLKTLRETLNLVLGTAAV